MTLDLPAPIAAYIAAGQRLDAEGMAAAFAEDAVVDDSGDGHHPQGRAEIAAWIESATIAVRAIFTPETAHEEAGIWILKGPVAGQFAGSPVKLTFSFTLDGDAITRLKIR
jgi:hypothetical protein